MKDISTGLGLCVAAAAALAAPAWSQCVADLNGDRIVDGADLGVLLNAWGTCPNGNPGCTGDLDSDGSVSGSVDGADLGILLAAWGTCPGLVVPSWATLIEAQPDPAVVTDPALRAAIEATGLAWRVRDAGTQMEMLLVPPGTFQMGERGRGWNGPAHQVTLTRAFYLGRYEVTQAQWTERMGSNPSEYQGANRPVERVSWNDVQDFCSATGMRFPTEAEWEYAYRAGTTTAFHAMPGYPNGTNDVSLAGLIAWCIANTCQLDDCGTRDVGLKAANTFGLHDMAGNVREWVNDWYDMYPSGAQTDPTGPASGSIRIFRGGGFAENLYQVTSSNRGGDWPRQAYSFLGFRVARTP